MALKIRCDQCRKKISIDEAFAGGVCRCPYCKALTVVPGGMEEGARLRRPERPGEPGLPLGAQAGAMPARPERPAAPVASAHHAPALEPQHVPLARPVLVQGIVAIVLSGLLVVLVAGSVFFYILLIRKAATNQKEGWGKAVPASEAVNPFTLPGARLAGMSLTAPVIYVIDGSSGMRDCYDIHCTILRRSIRSLGGQDKFNIFVAREEGAKSLSGSLAGGGPAGDEQAKGFLAGFMPTGATDLRGAVDRAIDALPKSVVVLADKGVDDPDPLIEKARQNGVKVYAIALGAETESEKATAQLCGQTDGQFRRFGRVTELEEWLDNAPPLP